MPINSRFGILLAEKEARLKRNIPLVELERETGITRKTLQQWANNKVTRFDSVVLVALCKYFDCEVCDLIVYEAE